MILSSPITSMRDAFSVLGMNVVVSGGNRGIGLGISKAFAESGANVAILCRNENSGIETVNLLKKEYGGEHQCFICDTTERNSIKKAIDGVYGFFSHISVLVNNAGISDNISFYGDADMSKFSQIMETNISGTANVLHIAGSRMKEAGRGGAIINISSISGQTVAPAKEDPPACPGYNVSKAAIDHLTKYLAVELGNYGIRVNAVAPGPTNSDIMANLPASLAEKLRGNIPMHRFGEPLEIGALCVFLASPAACHITGTVITHDGGTVLVG